MDLDLTPGTNNKTKTICHDFNNFWGLVEKMGPKMAFLDFLATLITHQSGKSGILELNGELYICCMNNSFESTQPFWPFYQSFLVVDGALIV